MRTIFNAILFTCFLVPSYFLQADCCVDEVFSNEPFIGPEIYYVKRSKEGGTEQHGGLYGARLGYDYIKGFAFYFGVDGLYAQGKLDGKSGDESKLRSELTDANVEGRLGYTLSFWSAYLTPFTGLGYFWEINNYQHPSPLHIHFKNTFYYVPVGFLSRVFFTPQMSIGLNFKARFLIEGKTRVNHDPEAEDFTLHYEEKIQYRVDLPFTYYTCWLDRHLALSFVPFYEYRHYGHRANFPFDFLDTTFKNYGASLRLLYLF